MMPIEWSWSWPWPADHLPRLPPAGLHAQNDHKAGTVVPALRS